MGTENVSSQRSPCPLPGQLRPTPSEAVGYHPSKQCQPLPRVLTRWQGTAGLRERSESVPCSQGRVPSPLSDDCHPLLRLLCQVPELVVGDNDPVSLFSQFHHEPVSKTTYLPLHFLAFFKSHWRSHQFFFFYIYFLKQPTLYEYLAKD